MFHAWPYGSAYDVSVLGLPRIRKRPGRFRYQRRTYQRTSEAPTTPVVSDITALGATVTWTNTETDLTGLRTVLDRRDVTQREDAWVNAADFAATNVTTTLLGLTASTTYDLRLYHTDANGRSNYVFARFTTAAS